MKEVKKEIFGSRKSILEMLLIENNISYIKNIRFVTCRRAINNKTRERYIVFIEGHQEIDISIFKEYVPIYRINFLKNEEVNLINLRDKNEVTIDQKTLIDGIIKRTKCRFVKSYTTGSKNSTDFSRFFRENMGKGFTLTDIDFFILNKNLFIEEKLYTIGEFGYLGEGQYYSFKEILHDICVGVSINILLRSESGFYIVNFDDISLIVTKEIPERGKMIEFKLGKKYSDEELLNFIK